MRRRKRIRKRRNPWFFKPKSFFPTLVFLSSFFPSHLLLMPFLSIFQHFSIFEHFTPFEKISPHFLSSFSSLVPGVFLFCWVPFFTCNIMDAICIKLDKPESCRVSTNAFLLTTWLGYLNSIVNPVIYTIFNPEFRKAFKKILGIK